MIPEFLEVMKQFKDQSYDKSEMTLHTKYLDLFFGGWVDPRSHIVLA